MIRKHFSGIAYLVYGFIVTAIIIVVLITNTHASEVETEETERQDTFTIGMNPTRDYLILVNEEHEYEFGGEYDKALQSDLIYVSDCDGLATPVEKGAYLAFGMLKADLHRLGFDIELYSAYRNKDDQQWVYDNYSNLAGWSEHNSVLPAGLSEHHTGLVISYVVWWPDEEQPSQSVWYEITAERLEKYPEFVIIRDALADYGFIERYPSGKEDITGVQCEPYEIRFVGSSKIAHEIMDNGLCLEEYLEQQSK